MEFGPVNAATVAVAVGSDETAIRRLLDQQVERRRMKVSSGRLHYELTTEGVLDLARERLIYAILAEFWTGRTTTVAGIGDAVPQAFGLTRRDLSEAATAALTGRWIAPLARHDDSLAITPAGQRAWAAAAARWPRFLAPLQGLGPHLAAA